MEKINAKLFELGQYMKKIVKDKENPFTGSKYADINKVLEETEPVLIAMKLLFSDTVENMTLKSKLTDMESGEYVESTIPLVLAKNDMQSFGSALTYARRYARVTMLSLQTGDDDGAAASGQSFARPAQIKKITKLILDTNTDMTEVLRRYEVKAIKDLYEGNASQLLANLEKIHSMKGSLDEK